MKLTVALEVLLASSAVVNVHGLLCGLSGCPDETANHLVNGLVDTVVDTVDHTVDTILNTGDPLDGLDLALMEELGITKDDPNFLTLLHLGLLDIDIFDVLEPVDCGVWEEKDKPGSPKFCYDPTDNTCGPDVWKFLPFEDNQCGGESNSPIELMTSDMDMEMCKHFRYIFNAGDCTWGDLTYKINDHSIKAEYPDTCTKPSVKIGKLLYELVQFHIHLGQEHSIDGEFASASLHMVHALKKGGRKHPAKPFAVVGFGMKAGTVVGETNGVLDHILSGFVEASKGAAKACSCEPKFFWEGVHKPENMADPYALLPENPTFYMYGGGLTTPPCTEVVMWNFLSDYVPVSVSQADTITQLVLGYLDSQCKLGTVADPKTAGTSRPPFSGMKRGVALGGACSD
jgi:carbonic anhydrase